MITSSTQPAYQYLRKILVLPVAASVVTLFAFSYKEIKNESQADASSMESILPAAADTTKPREKVDIIADKIVFKTSQKTAVPPASKTTSLYVINDKPYTREVFESSFGKDAIVEAKQVVSYSPNNTEAINLYGSDAKGGVLVFKDAFVTKPDKPEVVNVTIRGVRTLDKEPLYVIDGVVQKKGSAELTLKDLNPNSIEVINVLKNESATAKYGEDASEGVIEIMTKTRDKNSLKLEEVKQLQGKLIATPEKQSEPLKEVVVTGYARSRTQGNEPIKVMGTGTMQEVVVEGFPAKKATAGNIALDEVVVVGHSSKKMEVDTKTMESLASIYPNPSSNAATVSIKADKSGTGRIRIADMNGNILSVQKVALTTGTNNYTVNTSGLSKVTYLVSVSTDEGKTPLKAMKLIKE